MTLGDVGLMLPTGFSTSLLRAPHSVAGCESVFPVPEGPRGGEDPQRGRVQEALAARDRVHSYFKFNEQGSAVTSYLLISSMFSRWTSSDISSSRRTHLDCPGIMTSSTSRRYMKEPRIQ